MQSQTVNCESQPFEFAGRYRVSRLLGRGGMASVYEAWDDARATAVALKLLDVSSTPKETTRAKELFEREFHTLTQLAHPRVVQALDYGLEGERPYYTLELLDGGDLRELAPIPWQDVCKIAYEICSALSLLHSRRLVHRDLTPRNVRRTRSGHAKLIDFGLLSPMGATTLVAGTAPFVPPELVRHMSVDGRSDLFSLGATLYYALTGRQAYSARNFEQLVDAWRSTPARPSSFVPGIPPALDDLVLGMLRQDPASRPKSCAEVMDRLLPLLDSPPADELKAARAYLVTPKLVGRDAVIARFRKMMMRAVRGKGGGFAIVGEEGSGRSRMLDAFVLEAKLVGATAVRAGSDDAGAPFGVAASVARQIHRAAPAAAVAAANAHAAQCALLYGDTLCAADVTSAALIDLTRPELDRSELQVALRTWILEFASRRPLAIAIDDLERIDEPSVALFASLTFEARARRLAYLAVLPAESASDGGAVAIVRERAQRVELELLTAPEVGVLMESLFGTVPHLGALSERLAALSGGRPRECMALAEDLANSGAITYAGGSWTLPSELPDYLLPKDLEAALALRIDQLPAPARHTATLLAESLIDRLSRADLLGANHVSAPELDRALHELVAARLVSGDASGYTLTGRSVARVLRASLSDEERRRLHDELSLLHERAGRHTLVFAYHALLGTREEEALTRVAAETPNTEQRTVFILGAAPIIGEERMASALELATHAAERLGKPMREQQSLRAMLASISARGGDPRHFYGVAERWLRQAKIDSGWDDWQALDAGLEPPARAMMAVGAAAQRYYGTPEAERSQSPEEGIQQLVAYVLFSIAISSRILDRQLQMPMAALLEPFAPLSPMVSAILTNARATVLNGGGKKELSREQFARVLEQLESVGGAELRYVDSVRGAVCYALATIDTALGIRSEWLARYAELEDRNQQVSALFLQKVAALQQGDWERAEEYRREAELVSLQSKVSSMFSTIGDELEVHAMARDLTGVRQLRAAIRANAEKWPGWEPMSQVADAHYLGLCADVQGALAALAPALAMREDDVRFGAWETASRGLAVELTLESGAVEEALALGLAELSRCEANGMGKQARALSLAIAAAEAQLGRHDDARRRVEAVLAAQTALGVTGLQLGRSYEAAARVAISQKDRDAFERFAALAREQYRLGQSSVLGALYERLMDQARQSGISEASPGALVSRSREVSTQLSAGLTSLMAGCDSARERAERALGLLCDGDPPTRGHLLLVTGRGLSLVASNLPYGSASEIVAIASDCIDRESRTDDMETSALSTIQEDGATEYRDAEGNAYEVVLLGTMISDVFEVGGAALLVKGSKARAPKLAPLAGAIARALIDTGDAVTVAAS